jgi:hypothetical protein
MMDSNNLSVGSNETKSLQGKALSLLCPVRWVYDTYGKRMETLMIRRNFWNCIEKRPARSAGEWIFPGKLMEDPSQRHKMDYEYKVAYSAFVSETGYDGDFKDTSFIGAGTSIRGNFNYSFKYFISTLTKPDFSFSQFHLPELEDHLEKFGRFSRAENERIIEIRWDSPANWKSLIADPSYSRYHPIKSSEYIQEIKDHISFMGLDDSSYGNFSIKKRLMSKNTYRALSTLEIIAKGCTP